MNIEKLPFFALLLMFVVFTGCKSDSNSASDPVIQSIFSIGIRTVDANGFETVEFSQGEQILIEMPMTSRLNGTQIAWLADPGHPYFFIRRATEQGSLWWSNFDRVFPQLLVDIEFQPHETKVFGFTCNQLANDGNAFGPGEYEVMGQFGFDSQGNRLESAWHSFAILE